MNRALAVKVALAVFILLWAITGAVTARRALKGSNDFDTFHEAGRSALHNETLYEDKLSATGAEIAPFLYPPFAACFFLPFALFPLAGAALLWHTLIFVCYFASLALIYQLARPGPAEGDRLQGNARILFLFSVLTLIVFLDNISMAQINPLIFFLTLLSLWLFERGFRLRGGFALAMAVFLKVTPVFFLFFFLLRRQWRYLAGFLLGTLLCLIIVPALTFGWQNTLDLHRQWVQKMILPSVEVHHDELPYTIHLLKPVPKPELKDDRELREKVRHAERERKRRMDSLLNPKNQSLEAFITRWLLKDRDAYGTNIWYPVYPVQRYPGMPVLGPGIDEPLLLQGLGWIQIWILLVTFGILLFRPAVGRESSDSRCWEYSLIFMTILLISPFLRSHQFIVWLFPLALLMLRPAKQGNPGRFMLLLTLLFILQAVPYGKAAGFGAIGNFCLWTGCLIRSVSSD